MRNGRKGESPDLPFFMWRGEGRKKDTPAVKYHQGFYKFLYLCCFRYSLGLQPLIRLKTFE